MIIYSHPCKCGTSNRFEIDVDIKHVAGFDTCPQCREQLNFASAWDGAMRTRGPKVETKPEAEDPLGIDSGEKARPS